MLLTVLLSCLEEGALHSRTHSHLQRHSCTRAQILFCAPPKQTLYLVYISQHKHERTLAHLNACICLPAPAHSLHHSLNDFIFLSYFVSLSHSFSLSLSLPLLEGHSDRPPHKERHTIPADSRGSPSEAALPVASVH